MFQIQIYTYLVNRQRTHSRCIYCHMQHKLYNYCDVKEISTLEITNLKYAVDLTETSNKSQMRLCKLMYLLRLHQWYQHRKLFLQLFPCW